MKKVIVKMSINTRDFFNEKQLSKCLSQSASSKRVIMSSDINSDKNVPKESVNIRRIGSISDTNIEPSA